jgi:multiple sugar transport system substrate-binding protein
LLSVFLAVCVVAAGCGGGASKSGGAADGKAAGTGKDLAAYTGGPVELLVQDRNSGLTEEEFENYFAKPVKTRYPDITLKLTMERDFNKLVAGGTIPDLVAVSNPNLTEYLDYDYPEDLTPMIQRFKVDLNAIDPVIIDVLKGMGNGKIYGLPFGENYGMTMYNKDLFNKFGVPYPKDVITWDEYLDLVRKLTRMEDKVQYIGGVPQGASNLLKQYGVANIDAKEEKAVFSTDKHKVVFSLFQKFFEIPGLIQGKTYLPTSITNGKVAMKTDWIDYITKNFREKKPPFDWDLVAFPVFADRPNYGLPIDFHMLIVNKAGKNKEAAYRVLLTMIEPSVQEELTKNNSRISILKDPAIKTKFAQNSDVFNGKNLLSIFKVQPAPQPTYSRWASTVNNFASAVLEDMALNKKDMNTAIREQEEKATQALQAAKSGQK